MVSWIGSPIASLSLRDSINPNTIPPDQRWFFLWMRQFMVSSRFMYLCLMMCCIDAKEHVFTFKFGRTHAKIQSKSAEEYWSLEALCSWRLQGFAMTGKSCGVTYRLGI